MLLTMRHEPKYAAARQLVRDGAVGEPLLASAQKSYRLESRPDWFRSFKRLGGTIHALAFLIELVALNGRAKLPGENVHTVLKY